jgi:hypothetical protein
MNQETLKMIYYFCLFCACYLQLIIVLIIVNYKLNKIDIRYKQDIKLINNKIAIHESKMIRIAQILSRINKRTIELVDIKLEELEENVIKKLKFKEN